MRREEAARAEAGRLRAWIEELTEEMARAEEQVSRLAITREEVTRVLEEPPAADPAWQDGGPGDDPGMPRGSGRWRLRCSGGITRTRLEAGHSRLLATLFGTVTATRCARRKPGAPDYLPAGASGRPQARLIGNVAADALRGPFAVMSPHNWMLSAGYR